MTDVLTKAGVLLAIIVLAYALKRIGVFQTADYQILSKLVFRLSLPCAVITAFSEGFQRSGEMYLLALFGLGINIVLWAAVIWPAENEGNPPVRFTRRAWQDITSGHSHSRLFKAFWFLRCGHRLHV